MIWKVYFLDTLVYLVKNDNPYLEKERRRGGDREKPKKTSCV